MNHTPPVTMETEQKSEWGTALWVVAKHFAAYLALCAGGIPSFFLMILLESLGYWPFLQIFQFLLLPALLPGLILIRKRKAFFKCWCVGFGILVLLFCVNAALLH